MKKTSTFFMLALCMLVLNFSAKAQISGTVFRDFNANGVKNNSATFNEPFVAGVTVRAFTASNTQIGATKTTDAAGAYSFSAIEIPAGTKVRIEFSGVVSDASAFNGTTNSTNVQFATAPSTAQSYAVATNDEYWNDGANTTPNYLAVTVRRGPSSATGYQRTEATLVQTNTATTGPNAPTANTDLATGTITNIATHQQTGALFGLALQKNRRRAFTAAVLKRGVDLGPQGAGGVYIIDNNGTNFTFTGGFTLQGVTPSNSATALNFGTVTRDYATATNNNFMSNNGNFPGESRDMDAFAKATLMSYGDIEADPASDKIFMVNLFQRRIVVLNANATSATLNGATAATLAPLTTAFDIATLPGLPAATGAGNTIRPFAIKIHKGRGYLGVVSDAMTTQAAADLRGYVLEFDPNNIAAGFTVAVTINFNTYANAPWKPWATTWAQTGGTSTTGLRDYPMPVIAGIEFNEDGSMDIGIKDRWGDQGAFFEFHPVSGSTNHTQTSINGDLLHVCRVAGAWVIEGTAGSCAQLGVNGNTATNSYGFGNSYGNTGNEWYADRSGDGGAENSIAGMTKIYGSNKAFTTVYDPMAQGGNSAAVDVGGNGVYWSTQGVQFNDIANGQKTQIARIIAGNDGNMDKSNGMGDIEVLIAPAPIQIGNRIWLDTNGDGIQGSDETTAGVPTGTTVTLRSPGPDGDYNTTADNQTWTTTTDANGNYYFSALSSADNRKPATWTAVGNTLLPGYDYRIEVAVPAGRNITKTDASTNTTDNIDNDASLLGTNAVVTFNTGNTNHNFDIGFKQLATLGNKVWLDEGAGGGTAKNGVQDGTEPGVAGVAVNLYRNGADGLPGTDDDVLVGSTLTDAFGMYLFENLTPTDQTNATTIGQTSYNVRVTPPANYSITTQTNTTDDNNTTGASTTGSDVNALGVSYAVNLSSGENNPNIDAGLVFNTPTPPNSIGDKVWLDANGNGTNDGGAAEPGVAGVTVTLYNATGDVVAVTTTDAQGMYLFNNLPANTNFTVGFSAPAGTRLTSGGVLSIGNATTNSDPSPTTGLTTTINTGVAGTQITGVDAGLILDPKGAIGDYVWNDTDRDGIQDAGEPGVAGVTMRLYGPGVDGVIGGGDDVLLGTTITDSKGYYVFPNLDPAKYFVVATPVAGYTRTGENVTAANPGGDTKDSDFLGGTGTYAASYVSPLYTLLPTAGGVTRDMTVDLGIYSNAPINTLNTLGDKVWNDVDKDGIQDAGEAGVANVTVRLLNNAGVPVNNPATGKPYITTTDANGNYKFVDLPDGNYIVEFANIPAGYSFTGQDKGADDILDSDAKTITGRTGLISVDALSASATSVNITNVDAGISQGIEAGLASLGNRVWYDLNANGLQDAGELGVNNVKVELLDAAGNPVNAPGTALPYIVRTNALGEYMFTGLPAGDYTVRFSQLPAGFTSSAANVGANANDETDADATFAGASVTATTTATTGVYTLQTGEENTTVDMGIIPAGGTNSSGNFVWFDTDADGIQDAGELGAQGVMVKLYTNGVDGLPGTADDVVVGTTVTDKNGAYSFVGLPDGNYNVGFENLPMGFNFTDPNAAGSTAANGSDANKANGRTGTIALDPTSASAAAVNNTDVDAGIVTTRAALGNYVWYDADSDGVQDAGEKPVVGATVILYASNGTTVLASTITDATGYYFFTNLPAGDYVVGFSTIPSNTEFTQQNTPGDNGNNTNSDANPTTGLSSVITLVAGEVDATVDAGIKPTLTASVGDKVWLDKDGNGTQGANEPGVPGVVVTLKDNLGNVVGTAVTDGNGNYRIDGIKPGTGFTITFSNLPAGAGFTTQTSDISTTDVTLGSDANASGVTAAFNLTAGQYLPHVDAGLINIQVLPIKITSFTALPKGSQVNLEWVVSEQTGVDTYEVEASTDGRTFTTIATVASNGNQGATYDAVHTTPVAGINYYRIKTIEKDGTISYSQIRKVNFGKSGDVVIYPNPVSTGVVNITLTGNMINKAATVSILSIDGKLISQQQLVKTSQTETIDVSTLANGSYIIRLVTENEVVNKTIQVIR